MTQKNRLFHIFFAPHCLPQSFFSNLKTLLIEFILAKKSNKTGQGWIKDGTVGSIGGADDEVPKEEVAILKCLPSCCGICLERGH